MATRTARAARIVLDRERRSAFSEMGLWYGDEDSAGPFLDGVLAWIDMTRRKEKTKKGRVCRRVLTSYIVRVSLWGG